MEALARWLIELASSLVPTSHRDEWREAWLGEISHRRSDLEGRELLTRSLGAFTHAFWLAGRQWRMEIVIQDLKQAVKLWSGRPAFSLIVVSTLALGIGANTFVFSFVDGVLLHPFPYSEVDRLVSIGVSFPKLGEDERFIEALSVHDYTIIESESRTLRSFLAFDMGNRDLGGIDEPERLLTAAFWGDPFETLGMRPALGRGFTKEETERQEPVAVISHRVWRRHFGGDPEIVGRDVLVNGVPRTIVGVMPERLLLLNTDLWLPMWYARTDDLGSRRVLSVLARLEDGASLDEARSETATLARTIELASNEPHYEGMRLSATPFVDVWAAFVGPGAFIVLGAVGFVLLVACANIASLLIARGSSRRNEMAVRAALGAGRARLVRQLLLEATTLSLAGGLLGLVLAHGVLGIASSYLPEDLPLGATDIGINANVLAYTAVLSTLSALVFGLVPALQSARVDPIGNLAADSARTTHGRTSFRFRRAFVSLQIALSLVLLAGAGLLVKSFSRLSEIDSGVAVDEVLTLRLTLAWERYEGRMQSFFSSLVEEVRTLPGVKDAAVTSQFAPIVFSQQPVTFAERQSPSGEGEIPVAFATVASPGVFETMGQHLLRGRGLEPTDTTDRPPVAVVNETFASRYFPGKEALGERVRIGSGGDGDERKWTTIVGIVSDARNRGVDRAPAPEIVRSHLQFGQWSNQMFLLVRTEGDPMAALPLVREAVRRLDPNQPVYAIQTLSQRFESSVLMRRVAARMLTCLSMVAMALASMGLYGVVSYVVQERRREIGLRMALGAQAIQVATVVAGDTVKLVLVGVGMGTAGALGLSRTLSGLLFDVSPRDPSVLVTTALVLAVVALSAAWLPTRRAIRLDPVDALRTG